ncbi:hypothetical protein [Intrasporangium sp.]|uniref:hypothetical protein n=1 Tax=Intrasporangium sp. TaxID=1925024 RepID=UPI002B496105|nr:hypothetical protein [Intrasporangium sp.]
MRLRRLGATVAVAPLLVLGACSSEAPVTADPTRDQTAASTGTTPPTTAAPTPETTETTTTPVVAQPTKVPVKVTLKDPALGHTITATQVVRNMRWPKGHPVASEAFEIVGVNVKFAAGDRYTAELPPQYVTLKYGDSYARPTSEFGSDFAKPIKAAKRGETRSGWLIYKIDKGASPLGLMFHRPAYQVSTTDKAIKALVIQANLTK